ncbi:hypothetical protein [Natronomonas sp.]|uniref:hypothetical protein n=1 Tax=Natronomonas sp. TaxID=2184060 RepID=UPI0039748D74
MTAEVVSDEDAYLGLEEQSPYAEYDGNKLSLNFAGGDGQNGAGLNEDANSRFYNVFYIRNNGTNNIGVEANTLTSDGNLGGWESSGFALYWSEDAIDESKGDFVYDAMHNVDNVDDPSGNGPSKDIPVLEPGEAIAVHPQFFLRDDSTLSGDVPETFAFYASRTYA